MGILRAALALMVAMTGCYSPELRDCMLTCSAASDCADGQVCGSDHFCAAPGIAGSCSSLPGGAGPGGRDGGVDTPTMLDARPDAALPDAATHVPLAISIEGKGRVIVQGIATCDKDGPQNGMCTFLVPINVVATAQAQAYTDQRFDKWTTPVCAATSSATCMFTPATATAVGVKFRKDD